MTESPGPPDGPAPPTWAIEIDPRELGRRLRHARETRGLRQQQVAEALNMARTTVVAIEKGERRVQPDELVRFAGLYGRPLGDFLRAGVSTEPLAVQLRATLPRAAALPLPLDEGVMVFQQLCEDYVALERLLRAPLPQIYPPEQPLGGAPPDELAEDLAANERRRLGLGDGPLSNLRDTLEREVGLRIFYWPLPADVAGMFAYTEALGGCILVNHSHPETRRRLSLAHEYAHFLTGRLRTDVTVLRRYQRIPEHERFAVHFAVAFLMPAMGVRRRFNELKRARGGFEVSDLFLLADYYQVSLECLTQRLEELRLIKVGTWEMLHEARVRVGDARRALGLASIPSSDDVLPTRYIVLALEAYRRELVSEGRLAHFLRADRVEARRLVRQVLGEDQEGNVSPSDLVGEAWTAAPPAALTLFRRREHGHLASGARSHA